MENDQTATYCVTQQSRRLIGRSFQDWVWHLTKTCQRIRRSRTARLLHDSIVHWLPHSNVAHRNRSTRFRESATKQSLIVTIVRNQMQSRRDSASGFTPTKRDGMSVTCMFLSKEETTYIVTFVGSPLNAEMYFCTHRSAWRSSAQVSLMVSKPDHFMKKR